MDKPASVYSAEDHVSLILVLLYNVVTLFLKTWVDCIAVHLFYIKRLFEVDAAAFQFRVCEWDAKEIANR